MLFDIPKQEKPKKDLTLLEIAESKFGDDKALMKEIQEFLRVCRQKRFYPTKISWIAQCELLEKIPKVERVQMVHRSVMCGYRQMAYEQNNNRPQESVTRKKVDKNKIRKDLSF